MAVHSGKLGAISYNGSAVSTIGEWNWAEESANTEATASNTVGAPIQIAGMKDSKGSFAAFGKNPPLFPGVASATLIGDTGFGKISGSAFITAAKLSIDLESFKPLEWSVEFEGSGAITPLSTSSVTDSSTPAMFSPQGGKIRWQPIVSGTLGTMADLPTPRNIELGYSIPLDGYTHTDGWRRKLYATPLKLSITTNLYDDAFAAIDAAGTQYQVGTTGILHAYINASEYYTIKYATVRSVGTTVDAKTGKLTVQSITWDWSAWGLLTAGYDRGTLISPDATVLWS